MPPTVIGTRGAVPWPLATVRIVIGSPFGTRDGRPHEGIDLPAPVGTPVFAAADGQVAYAGNGIRGYGNLVVIKHPGDLLTVYAHNSLLLVAQGQPVRAGDRIALVGQSGRATGPHLHFEVRTGQIPRNPMSFLPTSRGARHDGHRRARHRASRCCGRASATCPTSPSRGSCFAI